MSNDYYFKSLIEAQETLNKIENVENLLLTASKYMGTITKCKSIWFLLDAGETLYALEIYHNGKHKITIDKQKQQKFEIFKEKKFMTFEEGHPILDWIDPHNGARYAFSCSLDLLMYECKIIYFYDDGEKHKSDKVVTHFANFVLSKIAYQLKINTLLSEKEKMNEEISLRNRLLCHDLSNSITVIKNFSLIGQKNNDPEKNRKLWSKVTKAIRAQEDLVRQAKILEAISSGKHHFELEIVDIRSIIEDAIFFFEDRSKEKNIELVATIDEKNQAFHVLAEKTSLSNQVVNNIVSNAIKFSSENSKIILDVRQSKPGEIKLSISDQGIGIPEEIRNSLFSFTEKTSRLGTHGEKGTGFGMPLVKTFMDSYGGSIEIETKEKQDDDDLAHGTTFHLFFKQAKT